MLNNVQVSMTPEELLRRAGLRVTAPRVMVLRALVAHPHARADDLLEAVRSEHGAVSPQGVYDVLRACTEAGIVRRIEPAGSSARYELRVADNHHHLVCRLCGAVADVDCAVGRVPCLEPKDALGFDVDEAEVVYWGTCPSCQKPRKKKASSARRRPGAAPREKEGRT